MNIYEKEMDNVLAVLREHERQEHHKAWDKAFQQEVDDWSANSRAKMDRQKKEMEQKCAE